MFNELSEQQYGLGVARSDFNQLRKQLGVLSLLHLHVVLGSHQFALNCLDPLVQVVLEVGLVVGHFADSPWFRCLEVSDFILQLLDLFLVLFDDFLTEVRPLGQLLLDFLVVGQVPLQVGDPLLHDMVLVHQVLSLLRLVLELASQLHVLDDRKLGGADQLVFVHVKHLDLDCPNLEQHLFPQRIDLLNFLSLNLVYNPRVRLRLPVQLQLPFVLEISKPVLQSRFKLFQVRLLGSKCRSFFLGLFLSRSALRCDLLHSLV